MSDELDPASDFPKEEKMVCEEFRRLPRTATETRAASAIFNERENRLAELERPYREAYEA